MTQDERDTLLALLADESLGQLSPEDRAALEQFLEAGFDSDRLGEHPNELLGRLLIAMDEATGDQSDLPAALRARIEAGAVPFVSGRGLRLKTPQKSSPLPWLFAAASIGIVGIVGWYAATELGERDETIRLSQQQLVSLEEQIRSNELVLAEARAAQQILEGDLALASAENIDLAQRLAVASVELADARLEIARYEAPVDPAELKQSRQRLLDVPDTVRVAWQPFDLPDAPAEQRETVRGDVVWNDELQMGYLRFEGLRPNDPATEQYQVWVIDERGMEQKVSGGVFNATAEGEVIVPIEPGIDVGRVAVFAVTVENPGGTWVPDLKRRVVVAATEPG